MKMTTKKLTTELDKLLFNSQHKTYDEVYKKWLQSKPSKPSREIMQPVIRQVSICIPKCINTALDTMEEDEAHKVINALFFNEIRVLIQTLIENMQRRGGTPNGKV